MHLLLQMLPLFGLGIVGLVVGGVLLQRHMEERAYYSAFERDTSSGGADIGVMQNLLRDVERRIRALRSMPPGRERSRLIRRLRADFHPDRHAYMPSLTATFHEVSSIINDRTDMMLEEDRRVEML